MTITNLYIRTPGSTDPVTVGNCITANGSGITISNCNLSDCSGPISYSGPGTGDTVKSNLLIINNRILNCNHGISIGMGNSACFLTNWSIIGNLLDHFDVYDGYPSGNHMDGIIILNNTDDNTSCLVNGYIAKNTWGPHFEFSGSAHGDTAAIAMYLDGTWPQCQNLKIVNNVFQHFGASMWADGYLGAAGSNVVVACNTDENLDGVATQHGVLFSVAGTNCLVADNLLTTPGGGTALYALFPGGNNSVGFPWPNNGPTNLSVLTTYFGSLYSDYNVFLAASGVVNFAFGLQTNIAGASQWGPLSFTALHNWQTYSDNEWSWTPPIWNTTHADPHSAVGAPLFVSGTFIPSSSDTIAHGQGTNLTTYGITTDFNGAARPASGPWDIGAFVAGGSPTPNSGVKISGGGNIPITYSPSGIVITN